MATTSKKKGKVVDSGGKSRGSTRLGARHPKVRPQAVTYKREDALAYARGYWARVCSDAYIAGSFGANSADLLVAMSHYRKVPLGTIFVKDAQPEEHAELPDGSRIEWAQLDDCTHFVSCCLGSPPGGTGGALPIPQPFPNGPYGILSADDMVKHLVSSKWVTVIPVPDKKNPPTNQLSAGDLIGYYSQSKGRYVHLVMYLGNTKIGCHTYCRSDDASCTWDNDYKLGLDNSDILWKFLHVTV